MCTILTQSENPTQVIRKGLFDEYRGLEPDDIAGVYIREDIA